jgi:predicted molibdopterin-dependent oxidoreductase YjgC
VADHDSPFSARRIVDHPVLGPLASAPEIAFTFEGRAIRARTGEPIAAALLAAGERVFRTMPKTGEARGGYCFVGRCADCLVVVDGEPNVMACRTPVRAGMTVERQRGLGSWASGEFES